MIVVLQGQCGAVWMSACTLATEKAKGCAMSGANRRIVVLNTGSSSLKFAAYPMAAEAAPLLSGEVEGIGGSARP